MGWESLQGTARVVGRHLLRGQTNFLKSLWNFSSVFNPELQLADHAQPIKYQMAPPPPRSEVKINAKNLYVHPSRGCTSRALDDLTERFVDETRSGAA